MAATTLGASVSRNVPEKQTQRQIIGIDLIRFIASFLVMNFHFGFWIWAGGTPDGGFDANYHWLAPYTWFGWVGVEIFFVISGFVIAYSAHGISAFRFAKSRFIRIYPTAWICATFTLVGCLVARSLSPHIALTWWLHSFIDCAFRAMDRRLLLDAAHRAGFL